MQIMPLVVGALAAGAAAAKNTTQAPCLASEGDESSYLGVPFKIASIVSGNRGAQPPVLANRAVVGYSALSTRWGKCVDVPNGNFQNGQVPQLWDCNSGPNQQWKISGNNLRTNNGLCFDVPSGWAYAGAPVQLWACDNNNQNQFFEVAGNSIRKKNSNFCLDVKDGHYDNGGQLQLWFCDNNAYGNQVMQLGGNIATPTQQSPSSFLGYATISWDKFAQLHPECAPWGSSMIAAASAMNLVPTLLGALAENEASCNEQPANGFGMFQFMDQNAWVRWGGANADKQKASDAIWGGARYIRFLLDQDGQNLDQALRDYNGPVWQGGDPNYAGNIRKWMSGGSTWA